jgi:hypothetical protein
MFCSTGPSMMRCVCSGLRSRIARATAPLPIPLNLNNEEHKFALDKVGRASYVRSSIACHLVMGWVLIQPEPRASVRGPQCNPDPLWLDAVAFNRHFSLTTIDKAMDRPLAGRRQWIDYSCFCSVRKRRITLN